MYHKQSVKSINITFLYEKNNRISSKLPVFIAIQAFEGKVNPN